MECTIHVLTAAVGRSNGFTDDEVHRLFTRQKPKLNGVIANYLEGREARGENTESDSVDILTSKQLQQQSKPAHTNNTDSPM